VAIVAAAGFTGQGELPGTASNGIAADAIRLALSAFGGDATSHKNARN
jgi:hypothetical protein